MHTIYRQQESIETFFKREIREARLLDPTSGFQEKAIPVEVRTDLFSGAVARVLRFRWRPPETSPASSLIEKSEQTCPFCPERMSTSTPKFPPSIVKEGRIHRGQATALPNAFPYSQYSGVVVFSDNHHIPLNHFTPEILFNAFIASTAYIDRVREANERVAYASINWNYMPPAGGGIIHPHLQVVVNEEPTRLHRRLITASRDYQENHGSNYWSDLISFEKKKAERYLYCSGKVVFLTSFCPGGMFGEVLTIFDEATCLKDVAEDGWRCFSEGLSKVLACFHRLHFDSLNMTLLASLERREEICVQARIIPRVSLPPLGTSDVNYFEKGHGEVINIISPEDLAEEIKALSLD